MDPDDSKHADTAQVIDYLIAFRHKRLLVKVYLLIYLLYSKPAAMAKKTISRKQAVGGLEPGLSLLYSELRLEVFKNALYETLKVWLVVCR